MEERPSGGGDSRGYPSANEKVSLPPAGVPGRDKTLQARSRLSGNVGNVVEGRIGAARPRLKSKTKNYFRDHAETTEKLSANSDQKTVFDSRLRSPLCVDCSLLAPRVVFPCVVATVRPQKFSHVASFYYVRVG